MVSKERAVEILLQNFKESDVIEKLREYLLDKKAEGPTEQEFSTVNLYIEDLPIDELKCFNTMGEYIDCEAGQILKKLAIYIINSKHKSSLSFFRAIREKYSLLKEIGADEAVVKRVLVYGYRPALEEKSMKILLIHQKEVVDFYITNGLNLIFTRELEVLVKILSVLLNSVNKKDKLDIEIEKLYRDRFEEARIIFEKIVEGCFKNKFKIRLSKVKKLVEKYEEFTDLLDIFNKNLEFKLEFPNKQGEQELITRIIEENEYLTERGQKILKAYIILEEQEFIYNKKSMEATLSLIDKIRLGDNYKIDYFYTRDFSNYFIVKKVERYIDKLIDKNLKLVKERVFENEESRNIKSCYLFTRLIEKEKLNEEEKKEYLNWFENKVIQLYENEILNIYKLEVEFNEESKKSFDFLKEEEFKEIKIKSNNGVFEMERVLGLYYDTLHLIDYSHIGINLLKLNQQLPISKKNTSFLDKLDCSWIREKDSEKKIDESIIKYYLSQYLKSEDIKIISSCEKIDRMVNVSDLRELLYNLYNTWLEDEKNNSLKNILIPVSLIASPTQLESLKKQVKVWAENSKTGLANFLIQCIAMRGDKNSLTFVDNIAKTSKVKRVKTSAQNTLSEIADLYGISLEELEEKIIPDFEFDRYRVRYFNYGERKIKAKIDSNLEIMLFDNNGKEVKSLPKASSKYNDNETLVAEYKEELKSIKKQLKTITDLQKFKMQKALILKRKWQVDKWQEIFIDNPIMNIFAVGLIWEERNEDEKILGRFRYMEDGSFNTIDEEEYILQKNTYISLANSREMSEEEIKNWKIQLEDYEITQPIEQLELEMYSLNDEEKESGILKIFSDREFSPTKFKKVMDKYDFKYEEEYFTYRTQEATYTDIKREIDINIILEEPIGMKEYKEKGKINRVTFTRSGTFKSRYTLKDVPIELIDYIYYIVKELVE